MDLTDIFKYLPEGTLIYSRAHGYVKFVCIDEKSAEYPIIVRTAEKIVVYTSEGKLDKNGECLLFPDKNNRDWSKYVITDPILFPYEYSNYS